MTKISLFLLAILTLNGGLAPSAYAQLTGGTISGVVRDQSQEVVVGAKVTATNSGTNVTRSVVTDDRGTYRLPALPVGGYEVIVEAEKFVKAVRQTILRVSEDARMDFELSAAGASEMVKVVSSEAPLTESSNSVLGIVIDNKQITELPLNGRNFLQLGTLVANVSSTASLKGGAEGAVLNGPFAVAGQRDRSLTFLVDGVDNNNSLSNSLSANVSIDAIQEFKMITNLGSAEFGNHSGGTVNIVTKSGTNEFHFGAFEFFRNNKLNSPNFLEKLVGQPASQFNNNQFGVYGGGPIARDRAFFFASVEGQRLRSATPQFSNVPTEDQRKGIFRNPVTGATVQLTPDPISTKILDRYVPHPNQVNALGNYLATPVIKSRNDFGMIRADYLLTGDDAINGRYFISDGSTLNPIISSVFLSSVLPPTIPGFGLNETSRTQNVALTHTHNFSVQTINELRFGYNRHINLLDTMDSVKPSELGFGNVTAPTGLFDIGLAGISRLGNSNVYPVLLTMGNFHLSDSLSFIRGRHSIKTGGDLRWIRQYHSVSRAGNGSLIFSGAISRISPLADFVIGAPTIGLLSLRSFDANMRQTQASVFAQDDYQVARRLVLNLGLRYELATVLSSPSHRLSNYTIDRGVFVPGIDTESGLYEGDHNNFAPRIGFAYMLTGDGRTVMRGGYGIYYDNIVFSTVVVQNINEHPSSPPWLALSLFPRGPGTIGGVFNPASLLTTFAPPTGHSFDQQLRTPYAQHFNLTLQRELGRSLLLSFGYVGTKTSKLFLWRDINQAVFIPGNGPDGKPLSTADNLIARRPTQMFRLTASPVGSIINYETSGSAVYHSFQATITKRLSNNLQIMSSYTWSKSIDNATDPIGFTGDTGGPQNSYDLAAERALSVFDIRHRLTVGYTYLLPFRGSRLAEGWQLQGIATMQSGQPFTPVLGFDPSLTGSGNSRPDFVPGAFEAKDGQLLVNPNLPLDPTWRIPAVLIPKAGQFGTLGRNTFVGDSYKNVDVSIMKETRLGERMRLQARAEVFNVFNTTNQALPVRRLTDAFFGLSRKTQDVAGGVPGIGGGGPRVVQLALKFAF